MPEVLEILYWISAAMLLVAALIALFRLALGPTVLDRAVAVDLVTAVIIGMTALLIIWWDRQDLMVLMIVFALTGFFSSVTIARFSDRDDANARRILSREEAQQKERLQREKEARDAALEKKGMPLEEFASPEDPERGGAL